MNNNELLAEALKTTDALIDAFLQKGYSGTGCFVDAFHQLMTERAELVALIQSLSKEKGIVKCDQSF